MLFFKTFLLRDLSLLENHLHPSYISLQHLNMHGDFLHQMLMYTSKHWNHTIHRILNQLFFLNKAIFKNFFYQHNLKEIKMYLF